MKVPFTGKCLCGDIKYTVSKEPLGMGHCHCRDCQIVSSTSHTSVVAVHADSIKWDTGEPKEFINVADSGTKVVRHFCPKCGTHLTGYSEATKDFVGIKAATMDDVESFKPTIDSYISSTPSWTVMSNETQKFDYGIGQ